MRALRVSLSALLLAALLLAASATAAPPDAGSDAPLRCVSVRAEARYGAMGYNHVVLLANACDVTADCTVSTDVNPDPVEVRVAPKTVSEVVTFLGSPASTFTPKVTCRRARAK